MIEKLLMILAVSFAGAFPLSARADSRGVPIFTMEAPGVFKQTAILEGEEPEGINVLFCLTQDGKTMQCIATVQDGQETYILISKPTPIVTQAAQ